MTEGVIYLFIYLTSVQVPIETLCQLTVKKKKVLLMFATRWRCDPLRLSLCLEEAKCHL